MENNLIILKQLDNQLIALKEQGAHLIPTQGWIKTIRKALGMTIKQLAKRLNVNSSRVVKMELSEQDGGITLRTMQSVAEAFGCVFTYHFIPKSSFEKLITEKAKQMAAAQVARTSHTMDLEAQTVDQTWLEQQIKDLTDQHLKKSWKYLWEE